MSKNQTKRDKWIEVNLNAVGHNLRKIKDQLDEGVKLIAVVKANAYGLGAVAVSRELVRQGVDFFGVSFLHEALELWEHDVKADILVFSPLRDEEYVVAIERGFVVSVASTEDWCAVQRAAKQTGVMARIHIKIDTGMGRFGLMGDEAIRIAGEAFHSSLVSLEGIYTHFAAPGDYDYTLKQFKIFEALLHILEEEGIEVHFRHCCASSAFLHYPFMRLDAVRIGTLLWGQYPAGQVSALIRLEETYRFKARIRAIRLLKKGSYLGYFRTYRLKRDSAIAVIPVGLVDGWGVDAHSKPSDGWDLIKMLIKLVASFLNITRTAPQITIANRKAVIRGKIFMQFCLAEVPDSIEANVGDTVDIPVKRTLASPSISRVYLLDDRTEPDVWADVRG